MSNTNQGPKNGSFPSSTTGERIKREKAYHNNKFSDPALSNPKGRYAIQSDLFEFYHTKLREFCPDARVLEYGCGPHSWAGAMMKSGAKTVDGIDISEEAISISQKRFNVSGTEGVFRFQVMNAEKLEFKENSFDLIAGVAILHHLDLSAAYSEIYRVLAPGGKAIFLEPMGHNLIINAFRFCTPSLRTADEHPLLEDDFIRAERFFLVQSTHFTLLPIIALPIRFISKSLFDILVKKLQIADRFIFKIFPALARQAWSVGLVLTKK